MKEELIISSKLENIYVVENFINDISAKLSINTDIYNNIFLSVIEGVTNAIIHGNKRDEKKQTQILVQKEKDILQIQIKDEGKGFDYRTIPNPTDKDNLEKPNGRGVFLMKQLSDGVEFKDNGAVVILKFKIK